MIGRMVVRLLVVAAIGAVVKAAMPDIARYMKIRAM
jgi:hypothetical protein